MEMKAGRERGQGSSSPSWMSRLHDSDVDLPFSPRNSKPLLPLFTLSSHAGQLVQDGSLHRRSHLSLPVVAQHPGRRLPFLVRPSVLPLAGRTTLADLSISPLLSGGQVRSERLSAE